MGVEIEVLATTGAVGAAKAAGVSVGAYAGVEAALQNAIAPIALYKPFAGHFPAIIGEPTQLDRI